VIGAESIRKIPDLKHMFMHGRSYMSLCGNA